MQKALETNPMILHDRLYQRGQTWEECRAGWNRERQTFARASATTHEMNECGAIVRKFTKGTRIIISYFPDRVDCLRILPILGTFLHQHQNLEVRYFDMSLFFPVLHQSLGRKAPILAILDNTNRTTDQWGPRPERLTEEISELATAAEKASIISRMDDAKLATLIDQSLAAFFQNHLNAA